MSALTRRISWVSAEKIEILKRVILPRKLLATHLPEPLVNFKKVKKSKSKVDHNKISAYNC